MWATRCYTHAVTVNDTHPRRHRPISDQLHTSLSYPGLVAPVVSSRLNHHGGSAGHTVHTIQRTSLRVSGWLTGTRQCPPGFGMGSSQSTELLRCGVVTHSNAIPNQRTAIAATPKQKHANKTAIIMGYQQTKFITLTSRK